MRPTLVQHVEITCFVAQSCPVRKLHRWCRWSIPRARVHTFLDTLREVQESSNIKRIELSDLEKLARYALCTRWHQNQDSMIAKEWLKEIPKLDTERKGASS